MNEPITEPLTSEEDPKEIRQAFGFLNPIYRTLSFLPVTLTLFGLLGTLAIIAQRNFSVTYLSTTSWTGRVPQIHFINDNGFFVPSYLPKIDFALHIKSALWIPEDGDYIFFLDSDDGSWLFLDGAQVLDNGGHHRMLGKSLKIHLDKGFHPLELDYRQYDSESILLLRWQPPWAKAPEVLTAPYIYLPESKRIPLFDLTPQRWLLFVGVVLLLMQIWAFLIILSCFPRVRGKMSARLILILLLGIVGAVICGDVYFSADDSVYVGAVGPIGKFMSAVFESFWGSSLFGGAGVSLVFAVAFVGIQYRLGKSFFESPASGIMATAVAAIPVLAGMSLEPRIAESLLWACLAFYFAWRSARRGLLSSNGFLFGSFVVLSLCASFFAIFFFVPSLSLILSNRYTPRRSLFSALGFVVALALIGLVLRLLSVCWAQVHIDVFLWYIILAMGLLLGGCLRRGEGHAKA